MPPCRRLGWGWLTGVLALSALLGVLSLTSARGYTSDRDRRSPHRPFLTFSSAEDRTRPALGDKRTTVEAMLDLETVREQAWTFTHPDYPAQRVDFVQYTGQDTLFSCQRWSVVASYRDEVLMEASIACMDQIFHGLISNPSPREHFYETTGRWLDNRRTGSVEVASR
ncbi:MAG: hypothetical protein AAF970_03230 [Bacteroidota bacterium]